jgi:putative NIF3 family GTP cyclohydrolase 1 type 2
VAGAEVRARRAALEPFGEHRGRAVGFVGRSAEGISFDELRRRCGAVFCQEPYIWEAGPEVVHSVGIVSGGAASSFGEAIENGLDAFLTGEPAEHVMADAREAGIHFIAAGHYATETFGVKALAAHLSDRFNLPWEFIDCPTGL